MKFILVIFIIFLSNCAGIPGKNLKLEDYPDISNISTDDLDITSKIIRKSDYKEAKGMSGFIHSISNTLSKKKIESFHVRNKKIGPCELEIKPEIDFIFCPITNLISPLTLTIIPYYCQQNYQINAKLISTKDNRILKEYELKEKVHEIWSLPMFLVAIPVKSLRSIPAPEGAKKMTEDKLAEALTRQVINDANNSSECKK